jgi:hypothetical protein
VPVFANHTAINTHDTHAHRQQIARAKSAHAHTLQNRHSDHRAHQAVLANASIPQDGVIRPLPSDRLQRWNPVRIGYERKLVLDDTGKVFTMRTMAMDPPIFEIDNFLTLKETKCVISTRSRTRTRTHTRARARAHTHTHTHTFTCTAECMRM